MEVEPATEQVIMAAAMDHTYKLTPLLYQEQYLHKVRVVETAVAVLRVGWRINAISI